MDKSELLTRDPQQLLTLFKAALQARGLDVNNDKSVAVSAPKTVRGLECFLCVVLFLFYLLSFMLGWTCAPTVQQVESGQGICARLGRFGRRKRRRQFGSGWRCRVLCGRGYEAVGGIASSGSPPLVMPNVWLGTYIF